MDSRDIFIDFIYDILEVAKEEGYEDIVQMINDFMGGD